MLLKLMSGLLVSAISFTLPAQDILDHVDPRIGSGGTIYSSGMTFPGATTPFGMVRLSPDTQFGFPLKIVNRINMATAGTHSAHGRLLGFSHTRVQGAGLKEGGAFRVVPMVTPNSKIAKNGHRFNRKYEHASPGRYSYIFLKQGIAADLTATPHCGIHRYRSQSTLALLINPSSTLSTRKNEQSKIEIDATRRVMKGSTLLQGDFSNRFGGQPLYFYAELSKPAQRTMQDEQGLWLIWETHVPNQVDLKLCISHVSDTNAKQNFKTEAEISYEGMQLNAKEGWRQWLHRIDIKTSKDIKEKFYSSLYRTGNMPTIISDTNGDYRTINNTLGNVQDHKFLSDLSLWDTFRTTHPLYTLIAPEIQTASLKSLEAMARVNNNRLPLWPAGSGDGGSMFGYPAHFLFAESWAKGIRNFDSNYILQTMATQSLDPNDPCVSLGYCPVKVVGNAVSQTLERSWANGVSATFAAALGEQNVADELLERSGDFKNLWNKGFFAPKTLQGKFKKVYPKWISYLDLFKLNSRAYAEGTPHQWRYSVPHRPQELIELMGGNENFVKELESFMEGASVRISAIYPGSFYWHGNEHDFHALYLFNEAGRADLTQKWSRWALNTRYNQKPNGLDGNDDGGTLSAWYVFSALGLYPQAGTDKYWIGSPLIDEAVLDLGAGRKLQIVTENNSPENLYIQEVFLNGKKLCKPVVNHNDLVEGILLFKMGSRPGNESGFKCL